MAVPRGLLDALLQNLSLIPLCFLRLSQPHGQQKQAFGKLYHRTTQGLAQGTQTQVHPGDTDLASQGMPSER